MPKSFNQKLKILYLLDMLKRETDEGHIITMNSILEGLAREGIKAERKSIYDDIESLRSYGYEIIMQKNPTGYYLVNDGFEIAELKTLVDIVLSSKFLSEKKSTELIKKLENLTSKYEATSLQRQVYVADRVKATNESIYYNVDHIHEAIKQDVNISFKYLEWSEAKRLVPRKNGSKYIVSPISLVWSEENYYLVGYDSASDKVKHYRVDKIKDIKKLDEGRCAAAKKIKFEPAQFSKSTFGMYGGESIRVKLAFKKNMIGVMIDRFGKNIPIIKLDNENFMTNVSVVKSHQFFGWLTSLGSDVKIIEDDQLILEYKTYIKNILKTYK
jgi:predicted DNA-binding transcriptional regulator YafY